MPSPVVSRPSSTPRVAALALVFALAWGASWGFLRAMPVLYDTDSYYHLAVARMYAQQGQLHDFPWARYSLLRDGFPDKDLLFHWFLSPFVGDGAGTAGGRLALALLLAMLAVVVAALAADWVGTAGLFLPFALVPLALDLPDRLIRLRPELLSLLLLLLATAAASRGRDRLVGVCGFLYTLTYTAFQLFVGLAVFWFLLDGWRRRRWRWRLPLYAALGVALGLLVHPGFPAILELWAVVNIHLFDYVRSLDAGGLELRPSTTADLLTKNLGFWLAALVLWRARGRRQAEVAVEEPGFFALAALVFGLLYLAMWRFAIYFFPFAALALAVELGRRGGWPRWTPLGGGRRAPTALLLAVALGISLPPALDMVRYFLSESAPGPPREVEWARFGRAVPEGARVAAPWGQAQAYLFYAPQARYLNFLDPVLMALPAPREFALSEALFAGTEPDVPLALAVGLDSDHLACSRFVNPRLVARAQGDPRMQLLYDGYNVLFRVVKDANRDFWLDWEASEVAPEWSAAEPAPVGEARTYPRLAEPAARALEGFVEAARVLPRGRCGLFVRRLTATAPGRRRVELASLGRAAVWVDGRKRLESQAAPGAVLGEGLVFDLALAPGPHRLAVATCAEPASGRAGFFLVDREPEFLTGAPAPTTANEAMAPAAVREPVE